MNSILLRLLVVVSSLFFFSCGNDLIEVNRFIDRDEVNYESITRFTTYYSDSAIVRVKIEGPTMLRHLDKKSPKQEFPHGVKVDFFDNNQDKTSELSSLYAIRLENDQQVILRDSVVWKSKVSGILETSELIWDEKKEKVFTNKFVVIKRPKEILYGYGFESNQDFSYTKIFSIVGKINPRNDTK